MKDLVKSNLKMFLIIGKTWYDKIPVSGEIRVGLMNEFNSESFNPKSFYVNIPEKINKNLCVDINSKDGRYHANLNYDLSNVQLGINEFEWPTSHYKELLKYNKQEITIICSIRNSCKEKPDYYVVSSWENNFSTDTVYVLVNSLKIPTIEIENRSTNKISKFKCKKINVKPTITYNCKCGIPKSEIKNAKTIKIVQRIRKINRISYNRYPILIKI